jgi:hypothetical protein
MSFKKTLCKIQNSVVQFPCIRPDNVKFRLDAHLSMHYPFGRRELSIWTSLCVQKLRTVIGCIRPDTFQCLTSKKISFQNTDMGRQLQL